MKLEKEGNIVRVMKKNGFDISDQAWDLLKNEQSGFDCGANGYGSAMSIKMSC